MPQDPLPRTLIFGAGVTGGVLLALSAQVILVHMGLDLGAVWRELFVTRAAQMRSAFAWWLVAGFSFGGGFVIAAFAKFMSTNWWRFRALRWLGAALLVAALTKIGQLSGAPSGLTAAGNVVVGVAALALSGLLAMLGAFFVVRR